MTILEIAFIVLLVMLTAVGSFLFALKRQRHIDSLPLVYVANVGTRGFKPARVTPLSNGGLHVRHANGEFDLAIDDEMVWRGRKKPVILADAEHGVQITYDGVEKPGITNTRGQWRPIDGKILNATRRDTRVRTAANAASGKDEILLKLVPLLSIVTLIVVVAVLVVAYKILGKVGGG